jgi:hypothetical protein
MMVARKESIMTPKEIVMLADRMAREYGYRWVLRLDGSIRVFPSGSDRVRCPLQIAGLSCNSPVEHYPGLLPFDNYLVAAEALGLDKNARFAVALAADSAIHVYGDSRAIRELMLETFDFISQS